MAQTLFYRIAQIITKIGTNGTKIPEPTNIPTGLSNAEREEFFTRHKVACEYLYASTAEKNAKARADKAKDAVRAAFKDSLDKMNPGDKELHNFDNVGIMLELRKGRAQIVGANIVTALATRGWKMDDIHKFVEEISETTKPALYLSSSTTAE